jgi:tetratricopeptide (TPR) repeat protein
MTDEQQPAQNIWETLSVDGPQIAALMQLGFTLFQQGKFKEARDIMEGLIVLNPLNPYPYSVMGSIHQKEKRLEEALNCFTVCLKLHPQEINTLTNRGEVLLTLGRFEEAAADLKAAIELDPKSENPAANRARFLTAFAAEALKLAEDKGPDAVQAAAKRLDKQLRV